MYCSCFYESAAKSPLETLTVMYVPAAASVLCSGRDPRKSDVFQFCLLLLRRIVAASGDAASVDLLALC